MRKTYVITGVYNIYINFQASPVLNNCISPLIGVVLQYSKSSQYKNIIVCLRDYSVVNPKKCSLLICDLCSN